ncbi:MAG TPA: hypothetical protein VNM90_19375 [Haliangium sp.]|nr:hypothetical protein [Haliangium sp.]
MSTFAPAMPHGDIEEVFDEVFFVTGTMRAIFGGSTWQFSRNMTIVRDQGQLTLINAVRLDDAGLAALDRLGKVTNVIKLGSMHGLDDAFYVDRYGAKLWALPGLTHESGLATDIELVPGGPMPFSGCSLFAFETSSRPEGILRLDRAGGILIAVDALQNWHGPDRFFDETSSKLMAQYGFFQPANIGPGWRQAANPQGSDFARVKQLSFRHVLCAHGEPLRDTAHAAFSDRFQREFGV